MWWDVSSNTTILEKESQWWLEQTFTCIIHADAGLSPYSLFLINHRFAPLQLMGLGHPVSTRGAHHIDYVLTSEMVDIPDPHTREQTSTRWQVLATQETMEAALGRSLGWDQPPLARWSNWDEVAMRIPGLGFLPMKPGFLRMHARNNTCDHTRDTFIILCPWSVAATHHAHVDRLRQIRDAVKHTRHVMFRFVIITTEHDTNDDTRYHLLYQHVSATLGASHVEMHVLPRPNNLTVIKAMGTRYDMLAQLAHDTDLIIEPYPHGFGWYIGVFLSLLPLKIPILTVQGGEWQNRIASALLEQAGLQEFIATCDDTLLERAQSLITDPIRHLGACARFARVDLDALLYRHYGKTSHDAEERSQSLNSLTLGLQHLMLNHVKIQRAGVPIVDITTPPTEAQEKPK